MSYTAIDLWLEEMEANLDDEVRSLRELACENEGLRVYWNLRSEEAGIEEEKALLREFLRGAEGAYHDTSLKQHKQQMRKEAAYEDACHDTLQEQQRQQMREEAAYEDAYYDTLADAMHSLQNYGAHEPQYNGNAYSYSSTYHDGQIKLHGTHPTLPQAPGG